ncbi:MAG: UDP-N-acetylmuramoyl-L-alanine--D-glutamate ligase, partial [Cytophagales bacterium]
GTGAALLAKHLGFEVFVSDMGSIAEKYKEKLHAANIEFEEGTHTESKILDAKEIIKSPGIDPKKSDIIQKAKKAKIKIIGEIEFAGRYTKAKKICITGTDGKTTTTMLTYHILKKAGMNVFLAGNIGDSFALKVLSELQAPLPSGEGSWVGLLELSSFMLDDMYDFKADVAIITNITKDHLDRYDYKIEKYVDSKFRILQNMDENGIFIYGIDSELIEDRLIDIDTPAIELPFSLFPDEFDGACGDEESITIQLVGKETEIDISKSTIKGEHNVYNTMAASLAAMSLGVTKEVIEEALQDFVPAPHRMQKAGIINGIEFVNDSKATTVNAAKYALKTYQSVIWIAGGVDKGNDYSELFEVVKGRVKALICLGKDNEKLKTSFKGKVPVIMETQSIEECIKLCLELGNEGDVALLSPCCASFDLFKNYEDRGNQFMNEVKNNLVL